MADILPKGTEIVCPRKRHLIGVVNTELRAGDQMRFKFIDFESNQARIAGEQAKCKLCDSAYFVQNKIYTRDGWKPSEPQLEPVALK